MDTFLRGHTSFECLKTNLSPFQICPLCKGPRHVGRDPCGTSYRPLCIYQHPEVRLSILSWKVPEHSKVKFVSESGWPEVASIRKASESSRWKRAGHQPLVVFENGKSVHYISMTVYFGFLPWGQIRGRQYEGNICYEPPEQSYRLALFPKHLWTVQAPFHIHRSKIAKIIVMYGHFRCYPRRSRSESVLGRPGVRTVRATMFTLSPSAKNVVKEPSWSSSNDIIFKEKVFFEKKKNWFYRKWKIWKNW